MIEDICKNIREDIREDIAYMADDIRNDDDDDALFSFYLYAAMYFMAFGFFSE